VIGQAHTILHEQGIVRIQTDIRVGSRFVRGTPCPCSLVLFPSFPLFLFFADHYTYRTDKHQSFEDKVTAVRKLLGKEGCS